MKTCPKCNFSIEEIMNFCGQCGHGFAHMDFSDRERRQVTVLFSDIVNFTRYTASITDDDVPEVLEIYQSIVKNAVFKQDGFIAQVLGDGVMAYFGYPSAMENATEHAIRAGLDLINAIKSMAGDKYDLKVRVGIHHGSGVITNVGGEGRLLVGNTPNVAARMQSIAEPNTLVISEPTYQATRGLFEVSPLGHKEIKGLAEPLEVFSVINHKEVRRFEIERHQSMRSLSGRERELSQLHKAFNQTKEDKSTFILISGQAGIGKSRLLYEFEQQVANQSAWVAHRCSAYRTDSAYLPLQGFLRHTIGLSEQFNEASVEKINAFLDDLSIHDESSKKMLTTFLSMESETQQNDYETLERLLITISQAATQNQPLVICLEDAHWVDQTSVEFLKRLHSAHPNGGLLILVTARPEFGKARLGGIDFEELPLEKLSDTDLTRMIHEYLGDKVINAEVPTFVISKADGNPLFVEELTHTLLDTGVITEKNGQVQLDTGQSFRIPETLHDTLASRVDQLGNARYVAQVAAVIGREFDNDVLSAVMSDRADAIQEQLDALVTSGIVELLSSKDSLDTYLFRHDLIRDAIYESMVRQQRETIHRNVAYTLETRFDGSTHGSAELLAQHWEKADEPVLAIEYYREASNRLTEQAAHRESATYCRSALNLVRAQPQSLKRDRNELELLLTLGASMNSVDGYASPEKFTRVLEPALRLSERLNMNLESFPIEYGIWSHQLGTADREGTVHWKDRLLDAVARNPNVENHVQLCMEFAAGTTDFWQSNFDEAIKAYDNVINAHDPASHLLFMRTYGEDPGLYARLYRQWAHLFQGRIDLVKELIEEARSFATSLKDPLAEVMAMAFYLHVSRDLGQVEETLEHANRLIARAERDGYPYYFAIGFSYKNWALSRIGKKSETLISSDVTVGASFGLMSSAVLRDNAEVMLTEARYGDALKLASQAEKIARKALDRLFLPDILRVKAEALHFLEQQDLSVETYSDALRTAAELGQKYWAVKAATSQFRYVNSQVATAAETLKDTLTDVEGLGDCKVFDDARKLLEQAA